MDTNTLLRIYQTYSLEKISALSKQSLAAQYAQNEQLVQLNKELAANNAVANKILKNQIQEIERQEKGRFYKNMIFNLKLATDKIENQPLINFRLFLSSLFLKPIETYAQESIANLEEISDKEYAQQIVERIKSISLSNQNYKDDYYKSAWAFYFPTKEALESKDNLLRINQIKKEIEKIESDKKEVIKDIDRIEKEKNKKLKEELFIEEGSQGCFGLGTLVILFAIGRQIYLYCKDESDIKSFFIFIAVAILIIIAGWIRRIYEGHKSERLKIFKSFQDSLIKRGTKAKSKSKEKEVEINKEFDKKKETCQDRIYDLDYQIKTLLKDIEELKMKDKETEESFASISKSLIAECHNWENQTNEIIGLLPHEIKGEGKFTPDPLLEKAARLIVSAHEGSTSLIQRKFAIGYNRAERIMNQLELVGVVGATKGTKSRDVLISDEETLEILLSKWR